MLMWWMRCRHFLSSSPLSSSLLSSPFPVYPREVGVLLFELSSSCSAASSEVLDVEIKARAGCFQHLSLSVSPAILLQTLVFFSASLFYFFPSSALPFLRVPLKYTASEHIGTARRDLAERGLSSSLNEGAEEYLEIKGRCFRVLHAGCCERLL